jgi:hypothetical protein
MLRAARPMKTGMRFTRNAAFTEATAKNPKAQLTRQTGYDVYES